MPATPTSPLLSGQNLHKTYRLGRVNVPVLKGASLEVTAGEWVAVLGSSGSGKSTLLHLLGGLDRPDSLRERGFGPPSEVRFENTVISSLGSRAMNRYRNRNVGFVFQFYHLLPELSVLHNATLPAMVGRSPLGWLGFRALARRARELLDTFGLSHRLHHRPNELSGGERQRVAIARALVNEPKVLLADEPTGNLDATTGQGILDVISTLHRRGLTIVMVTHDPLIAAQADRRVRLVDGTIAGDA